MQSFVVTQVDTAIKVEVLAELGGVSGKQSIPCMVVHCLGHYHLRTGSTCRIHGFYLIVCKCAVHFAEFIVHQSVACTIPLAAVGSIARTAVTVTATDGYVQCRTQT